MNIIETKEAMCETGRKIWQLGFVAANDGNFSVKLSDNEFLTTPTGVSKGSMTPDMIITVDAKGLVLEGSFKPSSELPMHLRVYKDRPDVGAIVHAHPPVATAFAVAHIPLDSCILSEAVMSLGSVPTAKYGTPSTEEIPDSISPLLPDHDVILLENHGALAVGADLTSAYYRMETLEHFAKISLFASLLGGGKKIADDKMGALLQIHRNLRMSDNQRKVKHC